MSSWVYRLSCQYNFSALSSWSWLMLFALIFCNFGAFPALFPDNTFLLPLRYESKLLRCHIVSANLQCSEVYSFVCLLIYIADRLTPALQQPMWGCSCLPNYGSHRRCSLLASLYIPCPRSSSVPGTYILTGLEYSR